MIPQIHHQEPVTEMIFICRRLRDFNMSWHRSRGSAARTPACNLPAFQAFKMDKWIPSEFWTVETRNFASQLRRSDGLQTGIERSEIPDNGLPTTYKTNSHWNDGTNFFWIFEMKPKYICILVGYKLKILKNPSSQKFFVA